MRKLLGAIGVVGALCLLTGASASARTEFGQNCSGNATLATGSLAMLLANGEESSFPGSAGPLEPRGPNAVITRWKAQVGSGLGPLPQQLVAFNHVRKGEVRNLGESAVEMLIDGSNEFTTRIPITAYSHIGLRGPSGALYCELPTPTSMLGVVEGDFPVGSTSTFKEQLPYGVPVVAIAEPDDDGDGYGDETQDGCAKSAVHQGPCPVLALRARGKLKRKAIVVTVSSSEAAKVKVWGQARWQLRRPNGKAVKVTKQLSFGIKRNVSPGAPGRFRVPLGRAVLRRLDRTKPSQRVNAILFAASYDLNGLVLRKFEMRLPGRG